MAVTQYLWDVVDHNLLAELDENGDVVVSYTNEPGLYGQPISMHRDGQSYFFQYDGSGNVVQDLGSDPMPLRFFKILDASV